MASVLSAQGALSCRKQRRCHKELFHCDIPHLGWISSCSLGPSFMPACDDDSFGSVSVFIRVASGSLERRGLQVERCGLA